MFSLPFNSVFKHIFKFRFSDISMFLKTSDEIESERLAKGIRDSIMEIVKKRENKAFSGEEDNFGNDFLGLLLKAHHDANENQMISFDNLVDECKTFSFAGQESTTGLDFLLAHHTDWQKEAGKEIMQLFGKHTPNPDGIAKLKTLRMIIIESLRLYPPIVSIVKTGEKEREVQLFKPERFAEGVAKATKNNMNAFLPFGMGPRTCVGLNFATTEAKVVMSMILQRYTFTLSPGYVHSPHKFLTVRPQHGVQVMLHSL